MTFDTVVSGLDMSGLFMHNKIFNMWFAFYCYFVKAYQVSVPTIIQYII